jgi:catecholate siderophore receptor
MIYKYLNKALKLKIFSSLLFLTVTFLASLSVLAQALEITGSVTDKNGDAVDGAQVSLIDHQGKSIVKTQTDSAGEFRLKVPTNGDYILHVAKSGMAEKMQKLHLPDAANQAIKITVEPQPLIGEVTVIASSGFASAESETVAKLPIPTRDLPQSVEIVNQQLIESQAVRSMQDALYNVTSVVVAQGEGRRDQFLIRGFNALGDQFIDGVRDDAPYYRELANVERIEVIKGPAAVLYGRGSSGGLINRVTKRPNYEEQIGKADLIFGSYGLKRGVIDFGRPLISDKLAFRLVGAGEETGSFRHYFFLRRGFVAPSLAWRPTSDTDVLMQVEYLQDHRLPDRGLPSYRGRPVDVPIGTYYGYPDRDSTTNRAFSQAIKVEHRINDAWSVRNLFRHIGYATDFYTTAPDGVSLVNGQLRVLRRQYSSSSRQDNFFNQTEATGSLRLFGWQHLTLFGVELGSQDRKSIFYRNSTVGSVSLINPILTPPVTSNQPTTNNDFDGRVLGLYAQDLITFARQWKLLVGARYDRFNQKLVDFLGGPTLGRIDREWSPRVGLVYQPTQLVSLYVSFTRSFQPSGENLSLATNNVEIKPETTRNYEAGVKAMIAPLRLNTTLAVFRLERDNIKTTDPQNPTRLLPIGKQRTDGIETTFAGTPLRGLDLFGGFSLLSARIVRSTSVSAGVPLQGRRAGLVPQAMGNIWMTYALPKNFAIGFGAYGRSKVFTSANNLVTLPGFVRFDAGLFWRREHYEAGINLRNITNRRYYETSHGDNNILPGAPINGSFTLRYRW